MIAAIQIFAFTPVFSAADYDESFGVVDGMMLVERNGKWGFANENGAVVIPVEYDDAWDFSEGSAIVQKNGKFGIIDKGGNVLLPIEYDTMNAFSDSLSIVSKNEKYGAVNKHGDIVIPLNYEYIRSFSCGLAVYKSENKYGYMNTSGGAVVSAEYDMAYDFADNMARVYQDGFYGYIDTSGALVYPFDYDEAWDFENGKAVVEIDGEYIQLENPTYTKQGVKNRSVVLVNGVAVEFEAYTIDDCNYFKLRDLAFALNGTPNQFEVGWDAAYNSIKLGSGQPYTAVGGEMAQGAYDTVQAKVSDAVVFLDGQFADCGAYNINDNNFFKLRDILGAVGAEVLWDEASDTISINTK